jgi:hypothetical protein
VMPFLLLDGYHLRFEIPFLDYIHEKDHEWVCCIGVPYGTHIWQVAYSPQMNEAVKITLIVAKQNLSQLRNGLRKSNFEMTDIIPLVRHDWDVILVNYDKARTIIAKRGGGPLNYALMDHTELYDEFISKTGVNVWILVVSIPQKGSLQSCSIN